MREMERLTLYSIEICISRMALLCVDLIRKVFKWLLTYKVVRMQTSAIYICRSMMLHLSHLLGVIGILVAIGTY